MASQDERMIKVSTVVKQIFRDFKQLWKATYLRKLCNYYLKAASVPKMKKQSNKHFLKHPKFVLRGVSYLKLPVIIIWRTWQEYLLK